jgi:hypothetical protein
LLSHYATTVQRLEQYLKPEQTKLSFADGLLFGSMEMLIRQDREGGGVSRRRLLRESQRCSSAIKLEVSQRWPPIFCTCE